MKCVKSVWILLSYVWDFFFQIRQNKLKSRGRKVLVTDKLFFTYKNITINFEVEIGSRNVKTQSKKYKSKIYVGSAFLTEWKKKTKVDTSLGDVVMTTVNAKKVMVSVASMGFTMIVKRGVNFFQVIIMLDNANRNYVGLCGWVPTDVTKVLTSDYVTFDSSTPLMNTETGTKVCLTLYTSLV